MPNDISKWMGSVLDKERQRVFFELTRLPPGGVLGGGTALALQIGHRRSYDFDIFYGSPIKKVWLQKVHELFKDRLERPLVDSSDELTVMLRPEIKLSLLAYPFPPRHSKKMFRSIRMFDVRDIASAKAYAIGRRGMWRDYVDMYFLLREHVFLKEIIHDSERRYAGVFDAKLFLEQLVYFDDLEIVPIEFVKARVSAREIQAFLRKTTREFIENIKS